MTGTTFNSDVRPVRWAGLAGVAFGVSVIVQNLWAQGAEVTPDADAGPAEVLATFADTATEQGILAAWVAANLVLMALFLAGAHARLRPRQPVLATVGLVGGVLLMAFFAMLNVPRIALSLADDTWSGELALVDALWTMHLATFAFAGLALGIALAGFSLAAAREGLVPRWLGVVGPVGAAVIVLASIPVRAGAEGNPATMVGLLGFLAWLAFLVVFGLRLRREEVELVAA